MIVPRLPITVHPNSTVAMIFRNVPPNASRKEEVGVLLQGVAQSLVT